MKNKTADKLYSILFNAQIQKEYIAEKAIKLDDDIKQFGNQVTPELSEQKTILEERLNNLKQGIKHCDEIIQSANNLIRNEISIQAIQR